VQARSRPGADSAEGDRRRGPMSVLPDGRPQQAHFHLTRLEGELSLFGGTATALSTRPAEAPPRAVSARRVGVSVAVSDQTRQAPAQALDLPLVLLELDLAGAALLENRAREDETFDS